MTDDRELGVILGDGEGDEPVEPLIESAPFRVLDTPDCRHPRSTVDTRRRTVTCRDCEIGLDPIEVLGQIASEYTQQVQARDAARRQREQAELRLQEAERDLKRMRGRRNRERKREADELAWDGDTIDLPLTFSDLQRIARAIGRLHTLSEYRHLTALLQHAAEIHDDR